MRMASRPQRSYRRWDTHAEKEPPAAEREPDYQQREVGRAEPAAPQRPMVDLTANQHRNSEDDQAGREHSLELEALADGPDLLLATKPGDQHDEAGRPHHERSEVGPRMRGREALHEGIVPRAGPTPVPRAGDRPEWSRCGGGSGDAAEYGGVAQSPPDKTGLGASGVTQRLEVPVHSQHGLGV